MRGELDRSRRILNALSCANDFVNHIAPA